MKSKYLYLAVCLAVLLSAMPIFGGAVRNSTDYSGFYTNSMVRNDDGSASGLIPIGFTLDFLGTTTNSAYVNNNGNITFDDPLGTYTPFPLNSTSVPIIAPFFADVDTRGAGSGVTQWGQGIVDGHAAFAVDYVNVGYYGSHDDKLNSFQLVLINRSDTGAGNFDIEFNYDSIQWETGDASGGINGLGGSTARAGYAKGSAGIVGTYFELAGSDTDGAFLDGSPSALASNSFNSGVAGRYVFPIRNSTGSADPGTAEDNPFLPDTYVPPDSDGNPGGWVFNNFPPRRWFDPPTAYGFQYQMTTPGALFTEVQFPTGFAPLTLSSGGTTLGTTFGGGASYTFAGSGVSEFTVTGINPLVDPALATAFPLWIDFNLPLASFTMTPLNITPSGVPEPGTWGLLAAGLSALVVIRRRKR